MSTDSTPAANAGPSDGTMRPFWALAADEVEMKLAALASLVPAEREAALESARRSVSRVLDCLAPKAKMWRDEPCDALYHRAAVPPFADVESLYPYCGKCDGSGRILEPSDG